MSSRPKAREVGRLALRPKWIALWLLTIAAMAACILLGRWQWDRTQDILDAERAAAALPVAIETLADGPELPSEQIGRPVLATGTYLDRQVLIRSRELAGAPGVWVVTPLRLANGSLTAVVRGWLPSAAAPGLAPPPGTVRVQGILHPDEEFYAAAPIEDGTALAVSSRELEGLWGSATRPGFVVLTSQEPAFEPAPLPVPPTVQTANVPFPLRNFFYAFQWWIFAAFAALLAARFMWLDAAASGDEEESP